MLSKISQLSKIDMQDCTIPTLSWPVASYIRSILPVHNLHLPHRASLRDQLPPFRPPLTKVPAVWHVTESRFGLELSTGCQASSGREYLRISALSTIVPLFHNNQPTNQNPSCLLLQQKPSHSFRELYQLRRWYYFRQQITTDGQKVKARAEWLGFC